VDSLPRQQGTQPHAAMSQQKIPPKIIALEVQDAIFSVADRRRSPLYARPYSGGEKETGLLHGLRPKPHGQAVAQRPSRAPPPPPQATSVRCRPRLNRSCATTRNMNPGDVFIMTTR